MTMRWLNRLVSLFRRRQVSPAHLACPYCNGTEWHEGPSGGMSTNIMCAGCQHWFNHHQGLIPMDDLHQVGPDRRPVPR